MIELAEVQKHMRPYRWQGVGRKRDDRLAILEAFVAKAVYNFPTTKMLSAYLHDSTNFRRLCGGGFFAAHPATTQPPGRIENDR